MNYPGSEEYIDPAQPYIAVFQSFEQLQQARIHIEGDLRRAYVDLLDKYRAKCEESDREKRNAVIWEKEQRFSEKELRSLRSSVELSPFAYVIIDGDGAVFREDLIARGEEGGEEAAHELHSELQKYFQELELGYSHLETFVQVVLSLEGLSKALFATGTLPATEDRSILAKFCRGFCRSQPLFSVVDVGYGKEQADHKVRKVFEMMEKNMHCRALILGGCHDNGYATFLQSFRNNHKVSLLETTPAAADFRKLKLRLKSFPTVFRSEPLPPKLVQPPPGFGYQPPTYNGSFSSAPPHLNSVAIAPPKPPTPVTAVASPKPATPVGLAKENERPSSWASVGKAGGVPPVIDISVQKKAPPRERAFYQLNKDNERVDVPLMKVDQSTRDLFDEKTRRNGANFCNRYHLLGVCKQYETTGRCPYIHGERLNTAEQATLRARARGLPCNSGSQCTDPMCTSGHHCSNPKGCWYDDSCRFSESHGMDTTPTIKIYEDGTREILV